MIQVDLEKLANFLVRAKKATYAGAGEEKIGLERPGHKELVFPWDESEEFFYIDSYVGFFQAPGMEEVRLESRQGPTIWTMAYAGGMIDERHGSVSFAKDTFSFLKRALLETPTELPLRGPQAFSSERHSGFEYHNQVRGNLEDFGGQEDITFEGKSVFTQEYIGGLVIPK